MFTTIVLLLLGVAACSPTAAPRRPHIVLVSADALRADHLSLNGYPRATSPGIDEFAGEAWHFTQAVTVIPTTAPSFATLFTGLHPLEHGVHHNRQRIPAEVPLLAELLRAHGYRTAAFVANPAVQPAAGFARGFDSYAAAPAATAGELFEGHFRPWADSPWAEPTFVWIHFLEPHGPYTPPDEFAGLFAGDELDRDPRRVALDYEPLAGITSPNKILGAVPRYQRIDSEDRVAEYVRRYDAEIRYLDSVFSRLRSYLEERRLYDGSAVLFVSDHGESLGEHDYYFEHGWFAYDATLRIPLLLKEPHQSAARRVDLQVSNLDLFATLLALAGVDRPAGARGRNLLGPLDPDAGVVVVNSARYPPRYVGVRSPQEKYLRDVTRGVEELYDLAADPGETLDRGAIDRDGLRRGRSRLRTLMGSLRIAAEDPGRNLKPDDIEHLRQLRALGYVD